MLEPERREEELMEIPSRGAERAIDLARSETERALSMQPESFRSLYFAGRMALFDEDAGSALTLVDEVTRGIQTRTRKTDWGCWIA